MTMLIIGGTQQERQPRNAGTGVGLGTCGELVQGFTSEGQPFHVSCPIEKSSTVTVSLTRAKQMSIELPGANLNKIGLSIRYTAEYFDLEPHHVRVAHWTDLEVAKGMGSSTADIVAAARAVANAVDRPLNAIELASIATGIESTDGSMYPGMVAFNQKTGATLARYKWWPQFLIVMVVPPNNLNTESVAFGGKKQLGKEFDEILQRLNKASDDHDIKTFAECATQSMHLNQRFVPNPFAALLEERLHSFNALGLNIGHTGTLVGLLFDASDPVAQRDAAGAVIEIKSMFPEAKVETTLTPACLDDGVE